MNLSEQCQKSADNTYKITEKDFLLEVNENAVMTEPLNKTAENYNKILIIADDNINEEIYDYLFNLLKDKIKGIISNNIPEKYSSLKISVDDRLVSDYIFLGASAGRAPVLINKIVSDYDLIIPVSKFYPDNFGAYHSALTTLFSSLYAEKTKFSCISNLLIDHKDNISYFMPDVVTGNKLFEYIRSSVITASRLMFNFAINIAEAYNKPAKIFAGDMFLSQIEASKYIKNEDEYNELEGLTINISNKCDYKKLVTIISHSCNMLKKGGRLLLNCSINDFGSGLFNELFYKNTLDDIINEINNTNYIEVFYAFILKYFTLNYHIVINADTDKFNNKFIQSGLNVLNQDELNNFFKGISQHKTVSC